MMETNFFRQLATMDITGDLQLTIARASDNQMVVSVILRNEQCGDNAKKLIPPLVFRETPELLDRGFLESIIVPMQQSSSLMLSMENYLKQADEAKRKSAMEKEKVEAKKKEQEAKKKKYAELMQVVDKLEKEGKYKEAWMKVPDIRQYEEQAEEIRKRKASLSAKFAPDLFGSPEPSTSITAEGETVDDEITEVPEEEDSEEWDIEDEQD
jgi:PRTRC genetic system protein E